MRYLTEMVVETMEEAKKLASSAIQAGGTMHHSGVITATFYMKDPQSEHHALTPTYVEVINILDTSLFHHRGELSPRPNTLQNFALLADGGVYSYDLFVENFLHPDVKSSVRISVLDVRTKLLQKRGQETKDISTATVGNEVVVKVHVTSVDTLSALATDLAKLCHIIAENEGINEAGAHLLVGDLVCSGNLGLEPLRLMRYLEERVDYWKTNLIGMAEELYARFTHRGGAGGNTLH